MEVRDLLTQYEFPGDKIPIVKGSAVKALAAGDPAHPDAKGDHGSRCRDRRLHPGARAPGRSAVPDAGRRRVQHRRSRHVATGRVERGILKKMEEVEIVGMKDTVKTTVTDIEMFRKLLDEARAGDNVGLLLRGVKKDDVERGQVIAKARFDQATHQVQG
jgi:elongation factor Tu